MKKKLSLLFPHSYLYFLDNNTLQTDLLPLESDVNICHSERSEETENFSRSVVKEYD